MKQIYVLVIGEDPDRQIKQNSDRFRSWKRTDWLYNSIVTQPDLNTARLTEEIFANNQFLPSAIIENSSWIGNDRFTDKSWQENLHRFIEILALPAAIAVYTCDV